MRRILISFVVCHVSVVSLPGSGIAGPPPLLPDRLLILDVDNTLYSESQAIRTSGRGIEEQIIANTYKFCQGLNVSRDEADALFQKYGSTIEGLRQTLWSALEPEEMERFMKAYYDQVWQDDFDYTGITTSSTTHSSNNIEIGPASGYSHVPSVPLHKLLRACPFPICFASNSPTRHVQHVKEALGLCHITAEIVTPDTPRNSNNNNDDDNNDNSQDPLLPSFPTKANPVAFFKDLFRKHPTRRILLDDSKLNLEKACWHGVEGIHVESGRIDEALAKAMGYVDREFVFSEVDYLKDKNVVDAKSIDRGTWEKLAQEIEIGEDGILRIADLGSGLFFMLEMILNGKEDKASLVSLVPGVARIEYHAYETNLGLFQASLDKLYELGFAQTPRDPPKRGDTQVFFHAERDLVVHLHWNDYRKEEKRGDDDTPHAIVGCCFADLIEPSALVQSLKCYVGKKNGPSPLVYFPITFAGTTQFLHSQPYGKSTRGWIPSDTHVFRSYALSLRHDQGHNLDPRQLVDAFERHGGELLMQAKSRWNINKETTPYFWKSMQYFFGMVAAPKLMVEGWDSIGWIQRSEAAQDSILVGNVDLLFRLDATFSDESVNDDATSSVVDVEQIQFTGPYFVETVKKRIDVSNALKPDQVLIQTICSLISSGTELKIYKGEFEDSALDVNIDGMADERMAYPLSYGYSSVGRITHVGSETESDLVGKLVFTFSPHATHVIASKESLQLVPDGISAEDAIFMPSVETALSLVHDAHVRLGEKVAVYGQGLIGLLVTSILAMQKTPLDSSPGGCNFGTITTFDTLPERLAMSSAMGSSQTLHPDDVRKSGPFDVSIEVSGNERALQSAIDHTRNGGRIIVGSWYGNADVTLKLGIDFHRSHKTIKTSQVSEIPAELSTLWTKERRFELTWELVKLIRPSQLLTKTTTLDAAVDAYDSLDKGNDIAVAFKYS
jgi:threonine dehydrogenase-like Zn-dependent dehydrogenase/FMN phosphatase YigB (HAD superfamily)